MLSEFAWFFPATIHVLMIRIFYCSRIKLKWLLFSHLFISLCLHFHVDHYLYMLLSTRTCWKVLNPFKNGFQSNFDVQILGSGLDREHHSALSYVFPFVSLTHFSSHHLLVINISPFHEWIGITIFNLHKFD